MRYLITGGCGFLGSNITARLLTEAGPVCVFDNLSRASSTENLKWLTAQGLRDFQRGDIRATREVSDVVRRFRPDVILHLAGQVSVAAARHEPRHDFEVNTYGTLNVLETLRQHAPEAALVFASSVRVYGDLTRIPVVEGEFRYAALEHPDGVDETVPLDFRTPFACSKGAAEQYVLDYAHTYGLRTIVLRHSTVYGAREFATTDESWVYWFCRQAVDTSREGARPPLPIAGSGKQVRDLLHVEDAVRCYLAAAACPARVRGEAFNVGGGVANSASVREVLADIEARVGVRVAVKEEPWRSDDQRFFVADCGKAARLLRWTPRIGKAEGLTRTLQWAEEVRRLGR